MPDMSDNLSLLLAACIAVRIFMGSITVEFSVSEHELPNEALGKRDGDNRAGFSADCWPRGGSFSSSVERDDVLLEPKLRIVGGERLLLALLTGRLRSGEARLASDSVSEEPVRLRENVGGVGEPVGIREGREPFDKNPAWKRLLVGLVMCRAETSGRVS